MLFAGPDYIVAAVLGVSAYAFGVVFDRVWDHLSKPVDRKIRALYFASDSDVGMVRTNVFTKCEHMRAFLDYIRTRMRIARNCTFVFPLLGLGLVAASWRSTYEVDRRAVLGLLVAFFLLGGFCFFAFRKLLESYYKQLRLAGEVSLGLDLRTGNKAGATAPADG
ncbi:MAG: hypothetical protein EA425_05755 [Puniceicoccaceae bacterium]|nr:MAG: hypothetical protein EA425_05755 [Puniceicoccaceae bacterium]